MHTLKISTPMMTLPSSLLLPPQDLMFMQEDHATMLRNGMSLLKVAKDRGYWENRYFVLDVGCGYGRMAYAVLEEGFPGRYVGLDILPRHIAWLAEHLPAHFPGSAAFQHLDIRNDRYNRNGRQAATEMTLPPLGGVPDLILVLSVFTHLYPTEIDRYLSQISLAMDERSILYATFFLINPEMRALEEAGASRYPMRHQLNADCWYFDEKDPLWAISFTEEWVLNTLARHGLRLASPPDYGGWCGRRRVRAADEKLAYQDSLFIEKVPG